MERNLEGKHDIEVIPMGMWSGRTELSFTAGKSAVSGISEDGNVKIQCDSIDNICAGDTVTFIKMDIEGSEQEALKGAEKVIQRDRPKLAICIYHSWEDLYEIPFLIKKMVPEYRLYIRHHSDTVSETVLYAVL